MGLVYGVKVTRYFVQRPTSDRCVLFWSDKSLSRLMFVHQSKMRLEVLELSDVLDVFEGLRWAPMSANSLLAQDMSLRASEQRLFVSVQLRTL
jgi:hypothetical protein